MEQRGRAQVDHLSARRDRDRGTDVRNAVAPDEDDLVHQHRARPAVEQAAGTHRHDLRRRRQEPGADASSVLHESSTLGPVIRGDARSKRLSEGENVAEGVSGSQSGPSSVILRGTANTSYRLR